MKLGSFTTDHNRSWRVKRKFAVIMTAACYMQGTNKIQKLILTDYSTESSHCFNKIQNRKPVSFI